MNLEQIHDIIEKYDLLTNHAKSVISRIGAIDWYYDTQRWIDNIVFDNEFVWVTCDSGLSSEPYEFSFPIEWLVEPDDKLKGLVEAARDEREERMRLREEAYKLNKEIFIKEQELKKYEELKAKYGKI